MVLSYKKSTGTIYKVPLHITVQFGTLCLPVYSLKLNTLNYKKL